MNKDNTVYFFRLKEIIKRIHSLSSKALNSTGLNRSEMRVLIEIHENNGITSNEIIADSGGEAVSTGIAIRSLDKKGLITRNTDPADRRIQRIFITEKGRAIKANLVKLKSTIEDSILECIDKEELKTVNRTLIKIGEHMHSNQ